jgi:energy-coupling factor transporter ATP-binding protein EcfA2
VHISKLKIFNLYSYSQAEVAFDDYNVVVGHNASGKTNLIRMLKLLAGESYRGRTHLDISRLESSAKHSPDRPAAIMADLSLSREEARLLLQLILQTEVNEMDYESLGKITVMVSWPYTPGEDTLPDLILLRFANGLSIWHSNEESTGYIENMPDKPADIMALIQYPAIKNDQMAQMFSNKHGFGNRDLLVNETFRRTLLGGKEIKGFFELEKEGTIRITGLGVQAQYSSQFPQRHVVEIYDFCSVDRNSGSHISLGYLLTQIFANSIAFLSEIPPDFDSLAQTLYRLRNAYGGDDRYRLMQEQFSKMFNGAKFSVFDANAGDRAGNPRPEDARPEPIIVVNDGKRDFALQDSASGYYDALYLLSEILSKDHSILILDEPALHLHPIKIKYLGRMLAEFARVQVVVITHSPYFVDIALFSKGRSLIYVKRDKNGSGVVFGKPENFNFGIKPHLFVPDIFFSKCSMFVEGPGDASALQAISDALNSIFEESDILIVYPWGKKYVHKYLPVLTAYQIEHVAMVDNDYEYEKTETFVKLQGKLEHELASLGWEGNVDGSIDPDEAYDFVFSVMQNDRKKVKAVALGKVVDHALRKVGKNPDGIW